MWGLLSLELWHQQFHDRAAHYKIAVNQVEPALTPAQ
jgi:asparagine synthase (glutamine-hydrolysing)